MIISIRDAHILFIGVDGQGNQHAYHISLIDGTTTINIDSCIDNWSSLVHGASSLSLEGLINYQEATSVESQQKSGSDDIQKQLMNEN